MTVVDATVTHATYRLMKVMRSILRIGRVKKPEKLDGLLVATLNPWLSSPLLIRSPSGTQACDRWLPPFWHGRRA